MAVKTIDLGPVSSYAIAVQHGYTGTEAQWYTLIHNVTVNAAAAQSAAQNAAQSAQSAANTLSDVVEAGASAVQDIQSEEATQAAAIAEAGAAQIADIGTAKTTAINAIVAQQGTSVQAVYDKGTEQAARVEAVGDEVVESIPEDYRKSLVQVDNIQMTKLDAVGTYTKLELTKLDGMWNFDTDSADAHSSRKYLRYEIPSGVKILGVRGYQFNADNAAFGFYNGSNELIYASSLPNSTDMSNATPIGVPSGAAVLYVNIGTGDTRGVWSFAAADVKAAAEQGLRMSDVTINNLTQFVNRMPDAVDPEKANFDSAVNGFVYVIGFTPTVAEYTESILNMPARCPGVLLTLSKNAAYVEGKAQSFYGTNGSVFIRTKLASGWREWSQLSPAVYYVGPTRTETSLVALLKRIQSDTFDKTIYVDAGVYDIFADYQANNIPTPPEDVTTEDYFDYNVFLPMNTKLIGVGEVVLEFLPTSSQIDAATSNTWSPLNLWYGGNTVENIQIHCKNCRYAIHDDSHSDYQGFKNVYRNVKIIAEANDSGLGFAAATGFGFADNSTYIFEDCDWKLMMSGASFYGHEGGHGGAQVIVRNGVFRSLNATDATVRLQTIRAQTALTAPVTAKFEGCYIGGKVYLQSQKTTSGQFFDTVLLKSGDPAQIIDYEENPYPINVYE